MEKGKTYAKIFGENLRKIRTKAGFTREEIANVLGITPSNISNYENGIRIAPMDKIFALAGFFGVDAGYFLGDSSANSYRLDRATEMAKLAGFKVYPADKENTLTVEYGADYGAGTALSWIVKELNFASEKDFVIFMETATNNALRRNITFKSSFEQMADIWAKGEKPLKALNQAADAELADIKSRRAKLDAKIEEKIKNETNSEAKEKFLEKLHQLQEIQEKRLAGYIKNGGTVTGDYLTDEGKQYVLDNLKFAEEFLKDEIDIH